jgi:hypothetical protein
MLNFIFVFFRIFHYICYPAGAGGGNSINCPLEGITLPLCLHCSCTPYRPLVHNFISPDLGLSIAVVYECAEAG